MKTTITLERGLLLTLCGVVAVMFLLSYLLNSKTPQPMAAGVQNNNFSNAYMIPFNKDTLNMILHRNYGENISIENDEKYTMTIRNMGTKISDFYNDNTALLNQSKYGFSIAQIDPTTIKATFTQEKIKSQEFVWLPSDVIFGIFNTN